MKYLLIMWAVSATDGWAKLPLLLFESAPHCERFAEVHIDNQPVSPSVGARYEYLCHPVRPTGGTSSNGT